ncbi:MAG TPA: hypothetical protein VMW76_00535 [Bacteroidales bacterium]|nr:hypothetical protein [Bacteroidales bacterium]
METAFINFTEGKIKEFNVQYGGYGRSGDFINRGYYAQYWSSSPLFADPLNAADILQIDNFDKKASLNYDIKTHFNAVRCVKG